MRPPHGRRLLISPPADDGRGLDAPLCQVAVKRRLRVPLFSGSECCPCCGECMDRYGDHALVCPCKGDRTVRHNELRNISCKEAVEANLRPEKEKANLLPGPRPQEDSISGDTGSRRPADLWLPRGSGRRAVALDFACSSGLKTDLVKILTLYLNSMKILRETIKTQAKAARLKASISLQW